METTQEQLEVLPQDHNIESAKRADAPAIWKSFEDKAAELMATAKTIVVTDVSHVSQMKLARTTRLELRQIRIAVEAKRKELGEHHLREKQRVDSAAKVIKEALDNEEGRLLELEQFAERAEAERIQKLAVERETELRQYSDSSAVFTGLGELSDEAFASMLNDAKLLQAAKKAEAERIENERIEREKAEAAERERIRLENERLKKEAAEREKAMEAERAETERQLKAEREANAKKLAEQQAENERLAKIAAEKAKKEREAREKAEAEAKEAREKIEAEQRRQREEKERIEAETKAQRDAEEAAAKKAAAAPDKAKLEAYAASMRGLVLPTLTTAEGKKVAVTLGEQAEKFALWIEKQAEGLSK